MRTTMNVHLLNHKYQKRSGKLPFVSSEIYVTFELALPLAQDQVKFGTNPRRVNVCSTHLFNHKYPYRMLQNCCARAFTQTAVPGTESYHIEAKKLLQESIPKLQVIDFVLQTELSHQSDCLKQKRNKKKKKIILLQDTRKSNHPSKMWGTTHKICL